MPAQSTPPLQHPYWLDGLAPPPPCDGPLPERADVLVIGSGYTGLHAALVTARAGLDTLVLEAGDPGQGCSTRNGGQVSTGIKPSLAQLRRRHGPVRARALRAAGQRSLAWLGDFVASERIDCDYRRCGAYTAAHTPRHFDALAREASRLRAEGAAVELVPRDQQLRELGCASYHGGLVEAQHASLQPAKYQRGLLQRATAAGVRVLGQCAATHFARAGAHFRVQSARGEVLARELMIATNGYSTALSPWLRRRVIPIASSIIATEPLPAALVDDVFPTDRVVCDTRRVVYYYRASPDRRRVVFGGRVSARECDPVAAAPLLQRELCRLFPALRGYRLSHAWGGTVAYSFDELPHCGVHRGVHYALGYCGSGVALASYLGHRCGRRIAGLDGGESAFDNLPHPTRPFYDGRPWFLPAAIAAHRWRDRLTLTLARQR